MVGLRTLRTNFMRHRSLWWGSHGKQPVSLSSLFKTGSMSPCSSEASSFTCPLVRAKDSKNFPWESWLWPFLACIHTECICLCWGLCRWLICLRQIATESFLTGHFRTCNSIASRSFSSSAILGWAVRSEHTEVIHWGPTTDVASKIDCDCFINFLKKEDRQKLGNQEEDWRYSKWKEALWVKIWS